MFLLHSVWLRDSRSSQGDLLPAQWLIRDLLHADSLGAVLEKLKYSDWLILERYWPSNLLHWLCVK